MQNMFEVQQIVIKHLRQEILSVEESAILRQLLATKGGPELIEKFKDKEWVEEQLTQMEGFSNDRIWQKFQSLVEAERMNSMNKVNEAVAAIHTGHRRLIWRRISAVAAVIVLVAVSAIYWVSHRNGTASGTGGRANVAAVAGLPGGNKAVLTLSDGRQINLDSSSNGAIADQGNITISKPAEGQLAYSALLQKPSTSVYNTLSTPRAGQFSLSLPDGTKVWLNNASSLRYPVFFTGDRREVDLTGEAYFEVAQNATMPFVVRIQNSGAGPDGGAVEVLGTAFNIMAYQDEQTERTTLVEGKVRVQLQGHQQVLQPQEQAVADAEGHLEITTHVNVAEVTAWKNGYFHFDHSSLTGTMRQLARWYDVEVEYKGRMTEQAFMGKIQRNLPLEVVLKGLANEHVHFQLEGRKLLVLP